MGYQHVIVPPGKGSFTAFDSDIDERTLWTYRIQGAAAVIGTGNAHLAALLLSGTVLLLSLLLSSHRGEANYVPLPHALMHFIASTGACCLSWVDFRDSGNWKCPALLSYVVALGIIRTCCRSHKRKIQVYRHMSLAVTAALILGIVQYLLPMIIFNSTYRPSSIQSALLACLVVVVVLVLVTPRPRCPFIPDAESDEPAIEESPEETCSLFSYYCSYDWITYVILRGFQRDLTMDDLPPLPTYDEPLKWLNNIKKQRLRGGKTFRTLYRLLKKEVTTMMGWAASTAVVEFLAPYSMLRLLAYLEDPSEAVVHPALWIVLLFVGPIVRSLCYQQYIFTATRLLVRVNMSLVQEIYQTAIKSHIYDDSIGDLSRKRPSGRNKESKTPKSGQANLTSLMSYDVDAIYNSRDIFYVATACPVSTTIAMVFLYQMLGWPSLLGVIVLFLLTPLPALASRKISRIQQSVLRATDVRLSKIAEFLNSIRTLKYFGWEPAAINTIHDIRGIEQQRLWRRSVHAAGISMSGDLLPFISLLVMFSVFVLFTDNTLHAPIAFTSLSIMETLRSQFVWLSNISRFSAQGAESLRRVDRFFESAEDIQRHPEGPLELKDVTFRRTPIAAFRLRDITLRFKQNALNILTGPTGCGKTSLLQSLLGETVLESGSATAPRDIAYVPQAPWLQNDTVRQNILFYSSYDESRYNIAVEASGLAQDLQQLPLGDSTVVGERGTSLSGGQKQRVSLARALYSRSSTLLLDDIFSALDTHTTSLVYKRCFRSGLLADRTVVLVTSLPVALKDAEMVIRLEHGKVASVQSSQRTSQVATPSVEEIETGALLSSTPYEAPQEMEPLAEHVISSGAVPEQEVGTTGMAKETTATGRVPRTLFFQYMVMFGGFFYAVTAIVATLTVQFAYFAITYWLSVWTSAYDKYEHPNSIFYLSVYAATIILFLLLQLANNLIYQYGGWAAAKKMHAKLVTAVLSAPISWFDENPIGRAINRFGNDTRSLDTVLIDWLRMSIENWLRFLLRIASIVSIMPVFAVPVTIICATGFIIGEMYTRAQISIKRLCSVNYSPVFSHFTDSLSGMAVIRARAGMDEVFQGLLAEKLAVHTRSAEAQYNCNRWVSVRSDFCAASVAAAAGCVAYFRSGSAGLVGFSLTNAIGLSQTILTLVRTMNELEVELNSYQRMREYADIQPEERLNEEEQQKNAKSIPASWPTSGLIEFQNVTARYQNGPDVLRNVSFIARPGERIGIVGRTGSGKSTLGLSLLRFVNIIEGRITIDGIDIQDILLNRLRKSVTLIPQEPVLFSGDVRSNLDPFNESSDTELRAALSACTFIQTPPPTTNTEDHHHQQQKLTLSTPVATNGENFSQGQRQVLSLARALCRRSKIVLLDEATASVDQETDMHMQSVLRDIFKDSTIIAIAHRLRTIVDYDRVVVMGGGEIVENDSPANLIEKRGMFWDMLRNTGEYDELVQLVKGQS
ncbi:putative ABC multidrug transporter [Aspergillus ruber CBS 135680]|uniref:Abc transporter n=1 Tax=Aspergillus ruber (strain CBS 135680) TaxID=1388766 RepID=A0A017SQD3_ASPRC|nr:abc transporter [Aspergillus ruber CBS 135680]EYE98824.1 abc transporter [Aspergillus ruber CBS 135680]